MTNTKQQEDPRGDIGQWNLVNDIENLLQEATSFQFHDFKNEHYATPKVELRKKLLAMAENVVNGIYDN